MNFSQLSNALISLGVICFGAAGILFFEANITTRMPTVRSCVYEEVQQNRYVAGRIPTTLIVVPPGRFYDSSLQIEKAGNRNTQHTSLHIYIAKDFDYTHSDGFFSKGLRADPRQGIVQVQIGSETNTFDFSQLPPQYNTLTWENIRRSGRVRFKAMDRCMALFVYAR